VEEIIWSADLAYVVGLITTDGNLSSDGRHLEFTSKDMDQLETFKRILKLKNRIGWKTSGYSSKRYPHIQFGNVKLYRWLVQIGLMPNKSKRLGTLAVPDLYFFDFLRGCLDGDGNIFIYQDSIFPNSQRLYISFASGSRPYLEWIHATTSRLLDTAGCITLSSRAWRLKYAKRDSQLLLKAMYHQAEIPRLERKYRIAKDSFPSYCAEVMELADMWSSEGHGESRRGSNPRLGTTFLLRDAALQTA